MLVLVIHFLPVFTRSLSMVELGVFRTVIGLYFSMGNIITSPMLRLRNSSATPPVASLIEFSILILFLMRNGSRLRSDDLQECS